MLFIALSVGCVKAETRLQDGRIVTSDNRECLILAALGEVGEVEISPNRSERIDMYNKEAGVPLGSSYCASGLLYCARNVCGLEMKGANAWVPSLFPKERVVYRRGIGGVLRRGNFAGYSFGGKRWDHVELFIDVTDAEWPVMAGFNTTKGFSRNGGGVHLKRVDVDLIAISSDWIK